MDLNKKYVITINRELGSGGRTIGRELAKRLGIKFYDKALIEELTKKFELSLKEIEELKAKKHNWWTEFTDSYIKRNYVGDRFNIDVYTATSENIFNVETQVLKDLAAEESCVIAGRSGFYIFRDEPNSIKIFIQSTMEKRLKRIMKKQKLSKAEAQKVIEKTDKGREVYTQNFSGTSRYDTHNYDFVINVANLTESAAVDLIIDYINKQQQ